MTTLEEYRVAIIGDGGVGKSSITVQLVSNEYSETADPTVEDYFSKKLKVQDRVTKLDLVDTAGQDEMKVLRDSYMRNCDGFVMVFDLTNERTMHLLLEFHEEICRVRYDEHGENANKYPVVLVGNKVDLKSSRKVKPEQAKLFAKTHLSSCPYLETSAAERINIDETFDLIVRELRRIVPREEKGNAAEPSKKRSGSLFTSISESKKENDDVNVLQKFK